MKKIIAALASSLSLLVFAAQAQTTIPVAPIEYSETVSVENSSATALYQRALSWAEGHFPYIPKTDLQAKEETLEISLTGTSKLKLAGSNASAPEQVRVLRFTFTFRSTDQGYTYSVGPFRVVPNAQQPTATVPLTEYSNQLSQERANARTHNDRRVTAQANAVASDVASAFRSYMNSQPVIEDGEVGLPANNGW